MALFYPEHDPDGLIGLTEEWYLGKIVSRSTKKRHFERHVEFEDSDIQPYTDGELRNNDEARVLSPPNSKIMFDGAGPDPHGEGTG